MAVTKKSLEFLIFTRAFFEQGGSARGAYIDLTTTGAGVGTNLLSSSAVSSVGGQTGAISNSQILSFVQAVSSTNNVTFDYVAASNNGYGQNFKVGDEVFYAGSNQRQGSYAEYQLVDERIVGLKPQSISNAEAAALPLTSLTAYEMLFDRLKISL